MTHLVALGKNALCESEQTPVSVCGKSFYCQQQQDVTFLTIHTGIGGGGFLAPQLDRNVGAVCVDVVGTGGKVACTGLVPGGAGHSVDLRCVVHTGSLVKVGVGDVHLDIAGGQCSTSSAAKAGTAIAHTSMAAASAPANTFFNFMITHLYLSFEKQLASPNNRCKKMRGQNPSDG